MDSYSGLKFEESGLSDTHPVKFFTRTFQTEQIIRIHYHNSLEINICRGVEGLIRLGERSVNLGEDCLVILPPETPHSYRFSASMGTVEVFHVLLDAFPGAESVAGRLLDLKVLPLGDCTPAAINHLHAMKAEDAQPAVMYGHLLLFMSLIADKSCGSLPSGGSFLRTVIDYTERHYYQKISLDEISSCAGLSRYHFSRKFKERTGETWSAYLLGVRLSAAQRSLKKGAGVAEAAGACGFESESYFIKCFKDAFGLTPLKWSQSRGQP